MAYVVLRIPSGELKGGAPADVWYRPGRENPIRGIESPTPLSGREPQGQESHQGN